ncbi:MAG: glycosyltransferase [Armatimonadota bacterium]
MNNHRIFFITDRFPPQVGGVGVSAARLSHGLAGAGHIVHVLHLNADVEGGSVHSERDGEVMVHRLGGLEAPDLTLQLADNIVSHLHERIGFDLFHGHFLTPSGYLAAYFARRFGAKSFVSVRGNDIDRGMFRPEQLPFILWTLQHAHGIGCVSTDLVGKCRALHEREGIHFSPNSVDTAVFRPLPKDAGLLQACGADGHTVLGFVGELRFKKGTFFLLDAFRAVHEQHPAKLLLIGGMRGEDQTFLRRFLRQHAQLRDDIHVIDYVHDRETLVNYYNLLDIVLSPSLWDGMPNSVLEAMACGRLVLASDAGGIRDVITHGENGLLVGLHELHRLGEGCLEIIETEQAVRDEIGQRARQRMVEGYQPAQELQRLLDCYAEIV